MDTALVTGWHRLAIGTHGLLALWLLGNGIAHQIGVVLGAWRGSLRNPDELGALLAVGAGLLVAGAFASWALAPLVRGTSGPALASIGVLALVVLGIALRFGWAFLGGTSVLAVIDVAALGVIASGLASR